VRRNVVVRRTSRNAASAQGVALLARAGDAA
jgi:hypothetical protein